MPDVQRVSHLLLTFPATSHLLTLLLSNYLHKNGFAFGTYCSLYSTYLDSYKWATIGTTYGNGGKDKYECKQSWTYTLNVSAKGSNGNAWNWNSVVSWWANLW